MSTGAGVISLADDARATDDRAVSTADPQQSQVHRWCEGIVGPCTVIQEGSRSHRRSSVMRLRTADGQCCYAKIHREDAFWQREVHAYQQWTQALGDRAPRLLGVYDNSPKALLISQLPGRAMEDCLLSETQQRTVWRAAGQSLARLHALPPGEFFGTCLHDGGCPGPPCRDAVTYVSAELEWWAQAAAAVGHLDDAAHTAITVAREATPLFAGERPVACHRDYGPANWQVTEDGGWVGVLDFEMAHWDVRMADFARYPDWQWMHRTELLDAMWEGYGAQPTPGQERQLFCLRVIYALSAIGWGHAHSHFGFAEEGRRALTYLAQHCIQGGHTLNVTPLPAATAIPELVPATDTDLAVVTNLSRLYIYDMSSHMGWACPESGLFGGCDEFFADWRAGNTRPHLIRVAGELAGFAAVKPMNKTDVSYSYMQEFFVLGKFRRKGVGRRVAQELFARHPGHWQIEQLLANTPAVLFWRRVIADHTCGHYAERIRQSPWGPMNVIEFASAANTANLGECGNSL